MEQIETSETGPKIHREIKYLEGQEEKVAVFESLQDLPIYHGFSWGKESANMSYKYAGEEEGSTVKERIGAFLDSVGIRYENDGNTIGKFEGTHLQTQEITFEDLKTQPETEVEANFIYTKDPRILLSIKPADCDVSILYAKNKDGKDLVGIVHSSALSANAGLPRYAIDYLDEAEGVNPATIKIGITPGISKHHYSISQASDVIKNKTIDKVIMERNWKQHIALINPSLGDEQLRAVDITGATAMQFIEAGVTPANIEVYDLDTYTSAESGESFSNRYSVEAGKPQGRYMVAVKLK